MSCTSAVWDGRHGRSPTLGAPGDASSEEVPVAALTDRDRPDRSDASSTPPIPPHRGAPNREGTAGGVSDASRRLRALAALSGSLTDPLTPEEAADVVERQALAVLGATSAVVVTLGGFPPNGP